MSVSKEIIWEYRNEDVMPPGGIYVDLLYEYKWRTKKPLDECRSDVGGWTFIDWYENGYITEPVKKEKD